MTEPIQLVMVGCGGMGRRHLAGLAELANNGHDLIELVAVCDLNKQNAHDLANEAESLPGKRPAVFTDLGEMATSLEGDLEAATCTTDSGSHHIVATELLDHGLHTLCEKPLALTIRGCRQIIDAAERADRILSVAENYRRDPMNRLVKALIDDGAIGNPQFILESTVLGKNEIFITPWRHQKLTGTITLDAGVHNADILHYYFGSAVSAFGESRILHPARYAGNTSGPGGFYEKWAAAMPSRIDVTGEDALFGLITFENGAIGQWTQHHAGHGQALNQRLVFGTEGSIAAPGDRNGNAVHLHLDDGTTIDDERILDCAPSYELSSVSASLFNGRRPWRYDFDFPETDRKLIALEYAELAECVRTGVQPEVDGRTALDAVALVYALFESQLANRPVTIEEIESGTVDTYQREIDQHYNLTS